MMPFVAMRESVREVLPWSTCARMQMLRMLVGLCWRVTRVLGEMEGIFAVVRVRGTERSCVARLGALMSMGELVVSVVVSRVRELFFKQSQGRLVQPDSWRCAGGGLRGALGRHDFGMKVCCLGNHCYHCKVSGIYVLMGYNIDPIE